MQDAAVCRDDHEKCETWAISGECVSNPDYMNLKCEKSCGQCDCKDDNVKCPNWAKEGECTKNPMYMKVL